MKQMEELVTCIARSLVDEPDAVNVTFKEEDDLITLELRVASDDLGKVIGKQGKTARAIRSLLTASAGKFEKRSRLDIVE